jgi:hypothetical protein
MEADKTMAFWCGLDGSGEEQETGELRKYNVMTTRIVIPGNDIFAHENYDIIEPTILCRQNVMIYMAGILPYA